MRFAGAMEASERLVFPPYFPIVRKGRSQMQTLGSLEPLLALQVAHAALRSRVCSHPAFPLASSLSCGSSNGFYCAGCERAATELFECLDACTNDGHTEASERAMKEKCNKLLEVRYPRTFRHLCCLPSKGNSMM